MTSRRDFLSAALAAPLLSLPLPAIAARSPIIWAPGTYDSRHALMIARTLHEVLREGKLYASGEWGLMDYAIPLTDPAFVVRPSDIMFHPTRGWRYEDSLTVEFQERGVKLGETFMFSNADYEAYWGKPKPKDRPDYALRRPHIPYSDEERARSDREIRDADWQVVETRPGQRYVTFKEIEAALGRDAIGHDMRWFEQWHKERAA